jgi:hypothetical protein
MSSGAFETGRYSCTKTGGVHKIKVQPETKGLTLGGVANAYAADPIDSVPSAKVSSSRRKIGITPRTVTIKMTAAGAGLAVGSIVRLPWFVGTTWNALADGAVGTYQATACELLGTSAEGVK